MGYKARMEANARFISFDKGGEYWEFVLHKSFGDPWGIICTHIGMYLKWCLLRGWASERHQDSYGSTAIKLLSASKITGAKFLIDRCDTKFSSNDLNDEGVAFTAYYYHSGYAQDFESIAGDKLLAAPETEFDFDALSQLIDKQYEQWVSQGRPKRANNKEIYVGDELAKKLKHRSHSKC